MTDLIAVEKIAQWQKLKTLVLDSVSSPITKRVYNMALDEFMDWFRQAPRPGFTKATVSAWRVSLEDRRLGSSSIIIRMSAIRKLAAEAADNGLLAQELPGFMQFITGVYLLIGLTWFNVFGNVAPLYMAGLAFTAYGIHWFAMAHRRYIDASAEPDGWMAIAFLFLSILGADVFRRAGDIPVMVIFVALTLIYAFEIPTRLFSWRSGARLVGLLQFVTGIWLMYCTYAITVDLAFGAKAWM